MKPVSFKQFLINESKTIYFTFGRMNPPTRGHEKLLERLSILADKNPYRIFLSPSHDQKKNPLIYEQKVKIARKCFPKFSRNIHNTPNIKSILDAAVSLYKEDFKNLVLVVGSDRKNEFEILLNQYNGKKSRHGFYLFESIKVISAGQRDPDSDDVDGVSSTMLRESAKQDDFISFAQGLPNTIDDKEAKDIFNKVRRGLGLNEQSDFKPKTFESDDPLREKYLSGNLYKIGDVIVIKETDEVAQVISLGSNYLIVETNDGHRKRKWLNAVEPINKE